MNKFLQPVKMIQAARDTGKGHKLLLEILIFVAVFSITQSVASIPIVIGTVIAIFTSDTFMAIIEQASAGMAVDPTEIAAALMSEMPDWLMLIQLFATGITTVLVILFCRFIEKRSLFTMGLRKKHFFREYGIGTLVGILLISVCVGVCALTGSVTLVPNSFSPLSLFTWVLFLIGFIIQGMSEEVVCRGYMLVSVSRKNALWLAVLTNSVVFSLLHLSNSGFGIIPFINIILFGVLESVYVLKRGDLWGACAIHSLWNFFQGNVFGISVSGTGAGASPLAAIVNEDMAILNGGTFGIEGGLIVTVVLLIATALLIFVVPANKEELVTE